MGSHRKRNHRRHASLSLSDRRFCRIPSRGRFAGVCAGIARYYNTGATMVRFAAVTAAIFVPQITLIAYIVAWLVLPTDEEIEAGNRSFDEDDLLGRERERQRAFDRKLNGDDENGLDRRRYSMRRARERLNGIEQRIRRLEAYITSSRFELQNQFRKL